LKLNNHDDDNNDNDDNYNDDDYDNNDDNVNNIITITMMIHDNILINIISHHNKSHKVYISQHIIPNSSMIPEEIADAEIAMAARPQKRWMVSQSMDVRSVESGNNAVRNAIMLPITKFIPIKLVK
jgi:hypothetical protein